MSLHSLLAGVVRAVEVAYLCRGPELIAFTPHSLNSSITFCQGSPPRRKTFDIHVIPSLGHLCVFRRRKYPHQFPSKAISNTHNTAAHSPSLNLHPAGIFDGSERCAARGPSAECSSACPPGGPSARATSAGPSAGAKSTTSNAVRDGAST